MVSRALIRWYRITYAVIIFVTRPYVRFGLHYLWDKVPKTHTPYLAISNHTTLWDFLLVGIPLKKQMYFVAGEHLFRNKFLRRFVLCLDGLVIVRKILAAHPVVVLLSAACHVGPLGDMSVEELEKMMSELV